MQKRALSIIVGLLMAACGATRSVGPSDAGQQSSDAGQQSSDAGQQQSDAGQMRTDAGAGCVNQCPSATALRCVANSVETCDVQSNGCLAWSAPVACPSNQTCQNGQCMAASCTDDCSIGDSECVNNTGSFCVTGADGCHHWSTPVTCTASQTCQNGMCQGPTCQNTCSTVGQVRCAGNTVEKCVATNGCNGWSTVTNCGNSQVCQNGACVAGSCQAFVGDACSSSSPCCSGLGCIDGSCNFCSGAGEGCTAASDCCPGSACQGGTCVAGACQPTGGSCSSQSDCCSGLACTGGTCQAQAGGSCSSQSDCGYPSSGLTCHGDNTCETNTCLAAQAVCASTSACCVGLACDTWSGACNAPGCRQLGASCSADSDCCSGSGANGSTHLGRCSGGACVWFCLSSSNCPANKTCQSDRCVDAQPCSNDFDCPSSSFCIKGYCQQ